MHKDFKGKKVILKGLYPEQIRERQREIEMKDLKEITKVGKYQYMFGIDRDTIMRPSYFNHKESPELNNPKP